MSDFKCASGTTGFVWKRNKTKMVQGRPARQVGRLEILTFALNLRALLVSMIT